MSYQVLARKWRPSTFAEMVGQAHVLRALINALDQGRLHHAYLFTGTRGVGKTTIARLLAKSLNCEKGVSSKPCGVCSSCTEIAEGRFVDLIEVDAASRTKVEDTRELLENVQYAPTRGRYKVYLIDEVHMLSTSSFNALLKTLEEPPPHVKFLLATTDPQKLPVTVLSRCLQFNLKNMSREHIVQHLTHVLEVEKVGFDEASLWAIAEAAQGSMRDALSLTDQAIAFGEGCLREQEVASMLGTVDLRRVLNLVQALFEKNIDKLMALVRDIDDHSPDYQTLMTEVMSTLHRVAIAQAAPNAIDNNKGDRAAIAQLAGASQPEDVHLFYQIAIKAKPDMPLAPSERAGFEMALLRMIAFSQTPAANVGELAELSSASLTEEPNSPKPPQVEPIATPVEPVVIPVESVVVEDSIQKTEPVSIPEVAKPEVYVEAVTPVAEPAVSAPVAEQKPVVVDRAVPSRSDVNNTPPWHDADAPADKTVEAIDNSEKSVNVVVEEKIETTTTQIKPPIAAEAQSAEVLDLPSEAKWPDTSLEQNPLFWWQVTLHRLGLKGMTKTLFAHSQWVDFDGTTLKLVISPNYRKIMTDSHIERILQVIPQWLPGCRLLSYEFGVAELTPQLWVEQLVQAAKDKAYQHLQQDSFVSELVAQYHAELRQESAEPNQSPIPTGA